MPFDSCHDLLRSVFILLVERNHVNNIFSIFQCPAWLKRVPVVFTNIMSMEMTGLPVEIENKFLETSVQYTQWTISDVSHILCLQRRVNQLFPSIPRPTLYMQSNWWYRSHCRYPRRTHPSLLRKYRTLVTLSSVLLAGKLHKKQLLQTQSPCQPDQCNLSASRKASSWGW